MQPQETIILMIEEEYGYREWVAFLTPVEWEELVQRWKTMRGLYCSVPVNLIIPQAVNISDEICLQLCNDITRRCHIHQWDDSFLDGVEYDMVDDEFFWMDGVVYTYTSFNFYYETREEWK